MLSESFFQLNFSIGIFSSIIGLILTFIVVSILSLKRQYHSIQNLLTCNTSLAVGLYLIFSLLASILGLNEQWAREFIGCQFRAYAFVVSCTILLYSHTIHAISRLLFVIFYKYKYFLTKKFHWGLIFINWFLGIILPIVPFFIPRGYTYEHESRLCTCTTKTLRSSFYGIITSFTIPFLIVTIIYSILVNHARNSTCRVRAFQSQINPINLKRELILLRNMTILLFILLGGGMPYLILVLWHGLTRRSPPEYMYLIIVNSITVCSAFMIFTLLCLNKDVRKEIIKKINFISNIVI